MIYSPIEKKLKISLVYGREFVSLWPFERLFWGEQQPVVAFAAAGCIRSGVSDQEFSWRGCCE
jgi:hypothetical protein